MEILAVLRAATCCSKFSYLALRPAQTLAEAAAEAFNVDEVAFWEVCSVVFFALSADGAVIAIALAVVLDSVVGWMEIVFELEVCSVVFFALSADGAVIAIALAVVLDSVVGWMEIVFELEVCSVVFFALSADGVGIAIELVVDVLGVDSVALDLKMLDVGETDCLLVTLVVIGLIELLIWFLGEDEADDGMMDTCALAVIGLVVLFITARTRGSMCRGARVCGKND